VYHVVRRTRYTQRHPRTYRLTDLPTRFPNDTPLPIGGYLAEFVRFPVTKDGTWIDDFTYQPRDRDRW
jgi:hypothetical protein